MVITHPCGPPWLTDKLRTGETIVIDGAMGTELQSRGVPMHQRVWSATAMLTDPDKVRDAHVDYIRAGAQVIITNTFSSGRHMLEPAGLADDLVRINETAVRLAQQAREQVAGAPVAIAGSICEWMSDDSGWSDARLRDSFDEQAALLAAGGVDVITIEMAEHPTHSALAVHAALQTGLPVWVGLTCTRAPDGVRLVGFDPPHHALEDVLASLVTLDIGVISVMHTPIAAMHDAIALVRERWQGPLGAYPESGHFTMPNWQFVDIIEPADLVAQARDWIGQGVQLVGGCCGLTIAHIAALKSGLP